MKKRYASVDQIGIIFRFYEYGAVIDVRHHTRHSRRNLFHVFPERVIDFRFLRRTRLAVVGGDRRALFDTVIRGGSLDDDVRAVVRFYMQPRVGAVCDFERDFVILQVVLSEIYVESFDFQFGRFRGFFFDVGTFFGVPEPGEGIEFRKDLVVLRFQRTVIDGYGNGQQILFLFAQNAQLFFGDFFGAF